MSTIRASIACNLDPDILHAALPLLEAGEVQAVEWSFDTLYKVREIPPWFAELLHVFSNEGRLIGHGVYFSLFSGKWSREQQEWLDKLRQLSREYRFDHITEHFGFLTGADFHAGAPVSLPFTATTLAIGRDRLARIQDACGCPVGLENLAFAYAPEAVEKHGAFLEQLVEPLDGFIILDLHNLYCQLHNFDFDPGDLLRYYPLDRVREIHISGGSWEDSPLIPGKRIRRDTHDDAVPAEVFGLLEYALPLCPNLEYVVLEQLGTALNTEDSRRLFRRDFGTMARIAAAAEPRVPAGFGRQAPDVSHPPPEDLPLHEQQRQLSDILETSADCEEAVRRLRASALAGTDWQTEQWAPCMIETALKIAQKWK